MKCFLGKKHRGDTLVEVSLAIGIFSMVAIAAVSVINGSTNGAQSSLESTITREEIDGQAEALRFIQSAYVSGGQVEVRQLREIEEIAVHRSLSRGDRRHPADVVQRFSRLDRLCHVIHGREILRSHLYHVERDAELFLDR